MAEIKVTIIIPVYNAETFLRQCLDSIAEQNIKSREVLCIDDGSTDSSAQILEEYTEKYHYIRVIHQKNQGSGMARNKGLAEAKGKYVAFCDADDFYYDSSALQSMADACEENGVSICGSYRKIWEGDALTDSPLFREVQIHNEKGVCLTFADYQNDYDYQSFLFERKLLTEYNITFPAYRRYQDPPFFVKAMTAAGSFWLVPVEGYCYRWGHQDRKANAAKIKYVLMGIKDNLEVAIQQGYDVLYRRLIEERLNDQYYASIMEGASKEVLELLKAIEKVNQGAKEPLEINAIKNMDSFDKQCDLWGRTAASFELNNRKNQSFEIFRKTALLSARGISCADILQCMGINEVYVYGAGEIGRMLLEDIAGAIAVKAVFDTRSVGRIPVCAGESIIAIDVLNPAEIPENDIPIIITPAAAFQEISYACITRGIRRERLWALHTLLTLGMKYLYGGRSFPFQKQFLITGAQFGNKGAQSMLYIATSEIRKRFADAVIWCLPLDAPSFYTKELQERYDLCFLLDGDDMKSQLFEIATGLTAIVDVSGYALSSYWENEWYMKNLRIAYHYNIPLYLMPQSFGPFEFTEHKQKELMKYLPSVRRIYVREKATYDIMKQKYGLNNLELSNDLVLQNKGLDPGLIYTRTCGLAPESLNTHNNVAVIPNVRNYEFGQVSEIRECYDRLIAHLLELGKEIYILSHSDDGKACADIYKRYAGQPRVHLYVNAMDCIQYQRFTRNFEYMIASRFHAIVHAYKENIPCIAIGWADKYKELLASFRQDRYMFDIRDGLSVQDLLAAVDDMDRLYMEEKQRLKEILPSMQQENCFDALEELTER